MASNTSNHKQSQGNAAREKQGGGNQKENWPTMDTAHEYMESAQECASDMADQASEYWNQGRDQMRGMVRGREGTTVLMALAAGVGVGLVIGSALSRSHAEQQSCNARRTAEQFGRRLMDRIENMIPEALSEHFSRS